ncbi:endoplasmic reticulum-based factor for assembly of V-ATPase-domain-containing protein [Apiospora arundinis]|uniref:Endoplasmic reticulum-based factor for assembly of V-ATPase-domain-containing protein n=1 Tax=Apiospora arundinis TaxID=335852 RepID=A0ABR2JCF1_9PEZI
MVLLTMTSSIVEAIQTLQDSEGTQATRNSKPEEASEEATKTDVSSEPSLAEAAIGKPITHGQIIDLWKQLKTQYQSKCSLEGLLRGATVYVPPPPPKPEPTPQYKALMERLRRDEEERSYERMLKAGPIRETFAQRFPNAPPLSLVESFAAANRPHQASDLGEETISQEEIQQQVTLIINFLISIAGCAAALWIAGKWWSTPARLFLTLGGSIVVAICEVAVYNAYHWRMEQGDRKQKMKKEVRSIVKTWVVGEDEPKEGYEPVLIPPTEEDEKRNADQSQELRKRAVPTT